VAKSTLFKSISELPEGEIAVNSLGFSQGTPL
jgi:hypothetical protein